MSEETNVEVSQESETFTREQLQELVAKEVEGLKNKNTELLGKLKEFQSKTEQIKSEAELAKEEALKKSGDIDELRAFYEKKTASLEKEYSDRLNAMTNEIKNGKRAEIINKLVGDFVDSESGSFMLQNMVEIEDNNIKFKDFAGNIVADNVDDFRKWMKTNPHMVHLVRGTNASGGNATGSKATSVKKSEMSRTDFDQLSPADKMSFIKSGGKTFD